MPCIFCRTSENLTEEHVFPAFSGAKLTVQDGSCKDCNNTCGGNFEQKIADQLETTRHIFEIQDRYGDVPKLSVSVEVSGDGTKPLEGVRGQRTVGGDIKLYDFVSRAQIEDGKRVRHGFFVSSEAAEKFIDRSRKRGETTTELGVPKEITLQSSAEQTTIFAFTYEARQLAAKIALVSLAYKYGTDYGCLPQFDDLREMIIGPRQTFQNLASGFSPTKTSHLITKERRGSIQFAHI